MADASMVGLGAERLARFLALGANIPGQEDQATAEILRAWLASPVPVNPAEECSVPALLHRPCKELEPLAGKPLSAVLFDPAADRAVIVTLKDYFKTISLRWKGGPLFNSAVALYYAAIAAALVLEGCKITSHSYYGLNRSLARLAKEPWLVPELAALFAKTRDVCMARMTR
jgi:hypothetical protein